MSNARMIAAAPSLNALVPAGVYLPFGGATAPTGWLSCDGSAVSRTVYSALFTAIGTTYGAGDGSTTFNLPSMVDRVAVGKSGTRTIGTTGGASSVTPSGSVANTTLSYSQMPSHRHEPRSYDGSGSRIACASGYGSDTGEWAFPDVTTQLHWISNTTYEGGGGAHNHGLSISSVSVEQPWTCCHYIIKY